MHMVESTINSWIRYTCIGTFWQENIGIQEIFSMINGMDKRSKTMIIMSEFHSYHRPAS